MADESPKVARLAAETISTVQSATAALPGAAATRANEFAETGAAGLRTAVEQASKAAQDFADFSRGNVEAFTQAAQTWFAGSQDISRQAFSLAQSLTEHTLEGARALSGVKSIKEAAEIQATYARGALDKMVSETTKLQEASFRLAEQVAGPVSQRVTVALERASKPIAA